MKRGFDSQKYLKYQLASINKRIKKFEKLYFEIGGKLLADLHASRVLPGYNPKNKLKILKKLKDKEIVYCINAKNIQSRQRLNDTKLTHDQQCLKDIKELEKNKLKSTLIIITRYKNQPLADKFIKKLKIPYQTHKEIPGYTKNINKAIAGYSKTPYFQTKKSLIIVTGVGSDSGKMAFCLSQIYHDKKHKINSGFAKLETFPVYNLPLNHPVNIAYEAATADLKDKIEIDKLHKKYYNKIAVNYNRDITNFKILKKLLGKNFPYKSPTDMGVNEIKRAIIDDDICRKAAIKEIHQRYKNYLKEFKLGREKRSTITRMKEILKLIS